MNTYFDVQVLCEESRRDPTHFLVVKRARPDMDTSGDAGSYDIASDEELRLDKHSFEQALRIRVVIGRRQQIEVTPTPQEQANRSEYAKVNEETAFAFTFAEEGWATSDLGGHAASSPDMFIDYESLDGMKAAARASQTQELQSNIGKSHQREAALRKESNYSAQSINSWPTEIQTRKNHDNAPMYRAAQISVDEHATARTCAELQQDASEVRVGEPLLECVHGGPGTGITEVLERLKELFGICGWQMVLNTTWAHCRRSPLTRPVGTDIIIHVA